MKDDEGLLATASTVLQQNGFAVMGEHLHQADSGWVLAESDLFIVAVVAGPDLGELRRLESFAAPELIRRLSQSELNGVDSTDARRMVAAFQDRGHLSDV